MRKLPDLARVRERLRQPQLARILAGSALAGPALLLMSITGFEARTGDPSTDPLAQQWGERVLEQERQSLVSALASEFDVPVPLAEQIHEAATAFELDPKLAFGLVRAESSFRAKAVSPVGALGLTQVMPATAREVEPGTTRRDLLEPETNLRIGFKYLRNLIDRYDGNEQLALTAYNRGPGTVNRVLKRGGNPDNGYADKVLLGESRKHVSLMNAKFGRKRGRS
jgi:soluble lytic murein transglycosylase-like protein